MGTGMETGMGTRQPCQVLVLAAASRMTLGVPGAAVTQRGMRSPPHLRFVGRRLLLAPPDPPVSHPRAPAELTRAEPGAARVTGPRRRLRCSVLITEPSPRAPGAAGSGFGPAQRLSEWQERSTAQTRECLFVLPIEFLFISCPYGYLSSPLSRFGSEVEY